MRILITGATGFVGRHLVPRLLAEGHEPVVLARDPAAAARSLPRPLAIHPWSGAEPPPAALQGLGAVVHLAGESLAAGRWSAERKRRILASRVEGTRALLEGLRAHARPAPPVVISASAIGYYGSRGDSELTEAASPGDDFLANVCRQWEGALVGHLPRGTRPVMLRAGMVLGADGGALPRLLPLFRAGLGGPLGDGRHWVSWIHVEDLVSLALATLHEPGWQGAVNGVTPYPLRNAEFTRLLARALHRPAFLRVPAPLLRLALGELAGVLLASQRVNPEKAIGQGFRYRFPTLEEALADLVGGRG